MKLHTRETLKVDANSTEVRVMEEQRVATLVARLNLLLRWYDAKIAGCDPLLNDHRDYLRSHRHGENAMDMEELARVRKNIAVVQAQRQAYVQAKHDIGGVFDSIG